MSRPNRRHARKASATTAEEILLPAELMKDLTSTLSPPLLPEPIAKHNAQSKPDDISRESDATATIHNVVSEREAFEAEDFIPLRSATSMPALDLAPLFPVLEVDEHDYAGVPTICAQDSSDTLHSDAGDAGDDIDANSKSSIDIDAPPVMPERGILKEPKSDEANSSLWSLWPGAKKWFSGSLLPGSRADMHTLPTFAQGAGIPAARQSTEDDVALSRTAPSIDFERSTNIVPPLSQERIKSTEFWSNFSLELDPTTLKRIRFSMPLIVTEFDPETSRVCDPHASPSTTVETTTAALRSCAIDGKEAVVLVSPPITNDDQDTDHSGIDQGDVDGVVSPAMDIAPVDSDESPEAPPDLGDFSDHLENSLYRIISAANKDGPATTTTTSRNSRRASNASSNESRSRSNSSNSQDSSVKDSIVSDYVNLPLHRKRSLQWDVEALSSRQYRVKEVWELYDRTCRSLDIEPLESFEKVLLSHVREERTLGSLDLTGSQINGVHMKCFADMLDLNFGLSKLELSHCGIDDDAVRLLTYSLLCNDSVRYLSLANNPRVRSDGIRYISILVRHSKQLQLLDISGIAIRKKSAGYLAAALAGLGANWSLGRGSMHKKSTVCEQVSLQALRMNSCGIKPAALAILASGVRLSPLQHLSLRLNSLSGSAGPILREMLYGDPPQLTPNQSQAHLRRPVSMSLHGLSDAQHCSDSGLPQQPGDGDASDSPRVSQLRSLDLSQNDLGRAVMDLAEGLLWNTNLRSLLLRQNKLQTAVFAPFMECLGVNKGLAYLDISRNPVCGPSPAVMEVLSQVVTQNQTLKALFMSATGMTSEGAIRLAESLPELHCLERLDVSENPGIEVAGLMALSASIKLNKSLICVEITVNTGDDVCAALEQGIAQTCIANMQRLDVSSV
ncbi:hypothetical protein EV175_003147, partial [Coemansia sp. RSA 1933]